MIRLNVNKCTLCFLYFVFVLGLDSPIPSDLLGFYLTFRAQLKSL